MNGISKIFWSFVYDTSTCNLVYVLVIQTLAKIILLIFKKKDRKKGFQRNKRISCISQKNTTNAEKSIKSETIAVPWRHWGFTEGFQQTRPQANWNKHSVHSLLNKYIKIYNCWNVHTRATLYRSQWSTTIHDTRQCLILNRIKTSVWKYWIYILPLAESLCAAEAIQLLVPLASDNHDFAIFIALLALSDLMNTLSNSTFNYFSVLEEHTFFDTKQIMLECTICLHTRVILSVVNSSWFLILKF